MFSLFLGLFCKPRSSSRKSELSVLELALEGRKEFRQAERKTGKRYGGGKGGDALLQAPVPQNPE
jgi:hypothetical protein